MPMEDVALIDYRKDLIARAVEGLLEGDVSFGQLTVGAICERAGISRPTFYRYFKDKYDVIQWFWDRLAVRNLRECGRSLDWYQSTYRMLRGFSQHARTFASALRETGDANSCIHYGYRRRVEFLREVVVGFDPLLLTDDIAFQIAFFTDAESRALSAWVTDGMRDAPEVVARRIESCVPGELHAIVLKAHRRYLAEKPAPASSDHGIKSR